MMIRKGISHECEGVGCAAVWCLLIVTIHITLKLLVTARLAVIFWEIVVIWFIYKAL